MLSKSHPIILFVDRFGFSVYQDTLTGIPKFNFTQDLVSNLDVVSKEQFAKLIATFIQINKIIPSSLAVILSDNVIFVKDLVNPVQKPAPVQGLKVDSDDNKDHKDEVQSFLEDIPFEEVLAKVIKIGNVNRIVAVNKDLIMTIINAFTGKESTIEAITPSFVFGQNANFTAGLTLNNVKIVLEDTETLKLGNLLTGQEKIVPSPTLGSELGNPPVKEAKKPQNLRQYILIGVFVILLIILAVVYLNVSQTPPQSSKKSTGAAVNETNVKPTAIPTLVQESITTAPIDLKTINIKISHSAQSSEIAASLKSGLSGMGFSNVLDEISGVSAPEKSSAVFSQNIPADLRNSIVAEIKEILPDVSISESQDSNSTLNILIGKS